MFDLKDVPETARVMMTLPFRSHRLKATSPTAHSNERQSARNATHGIQIATSALPGDPGHVSHPSLERQDTTNDDQDD